jgi:AGZA family xanthine/uracil permease-like MFS transporter
MQQLAAWLDRRFELARHGTTIRVEILGGVTTFITMAYIIVVNPAILKAAGLPEGPSTVATVLTAVFGTAFMAIYANRPIAVAPYMGENAFLAFSLAATITWQQRLGSVFVSGLAFMALTALHVRQWLVDAISTSMKHAFAVGIGLFLAFIGLFQTGMVAKHPAPDVPVRIGDFHDPRVLLAAGTFVLISLLLYHRVRGAIFIGMATSALIGYLMGIGQGPAGVWALPFTGEYSLAAIAFQLDIAGVLRFDFLPILLTLFIMSLLDTLGTLVGVGAAGGMLDEKGNFPDIHKPMMVDAAACTLGALVGTSTSGAYIESATGIREGARTGLASLTTAFLFALSLFFLPLVAPLQKLTFAWGPALIAVGLLMLAHVRNVDFDDLTELVPAFVSIALIVFTYNIANGLTAGLIVHPLVKLCAGRWRQIHPGAVLLAALCSTYYIKGLGILH